MTATCLHCRLPIRLRPSRLDEDRNLWTSPSSSIPLVCWPRPGAVKDHQPAPSFEEQVREALRDVEAAVRDSRADGWTDDKIHEDDLYHEMVVSITFGLPRPVANEVRRRFGFDPVADF
jgi:hypothetical protein